MIAKELRSRDLQISQQLKEIEKYRQERKQNLCGFCRKKMDSVSCKSESRSVEVQTEEVTGFRTISVGYANDRAAIEASLGGSEELADDDWYANANSDNENEKSSVNFYERGVNPVLERVNQVSESGERETLDGRVVGFRVLSKGGWLIGLLHIVVYN